MFRSIDSHSVKEDINNDYGIYPESGDVVMEVVDKNSEYYEQQASAGGKENNGRQASDYDHMYDHMYDH